MFNNPFMYNNFMANPGISRGLFSGLKSINWSGFLSNTQKTLGIINQAIPIAYQVKPIMNNARSMFKIANIINSNDNVESNTNSNNNTSNNSNITTNYTNKPVFYI